MLKKSYVPLHFKISQQLISGKDGGQNNLGEEKHSCLRPMKYRQTAECLTETSQLLIKP